VFVSYLVFRFVMITIVGVSRCGKP